MSDLLNDLNEAILDSQPGARCAFCEALKTMEIMESPGTSEAFQSAIMDRKIGTAKVARLLTANGYSVGDKVIIRHRTQGHAWNSSTS